MRYLYSFFLSVIVSFSGVTVIQAQIYGDHKADTVVYSGIYRGIKDSVYVYNESLAQGNLFTKSGTLTAVSPDNAGGWTFIWSKLNYATKKFEAIDTVTGTNSTQTDLENGGYQVRMIKGTLDTTFRAWIFINRLRLVLRKTSTGIVSPFYSNCKYVQLGPVKKKEPNANPDSTYIHSSFQYLDSVGRIGTLKNDTVVEWTASPAFEGGLEAQPQIFIYDPPTDTTIFTINLRDRFGNTATDQVKYEPITTKADFEAHLWKVEKKIFDTDTSNREGEAPLRTKFLNLSKNGYDFKWIIKDSALNVGSGKQPASKITSEKSDSFMYVFYYPRTYKVKLFSVGPSGICSDSIEKTIKVTDSKFGSDELRFPTKFYPASSIEENKYFVFKKDTISIPWTSIRNLKFLVFNQSGTVFYRYDGPMEPGWKGWNGKKDNKGSDAPAGVYFYAYEVLGWGPIGPSKTSDSNSGGGTVDPGNNDSGSDETTLKPAKPIKGGGFVYLLRE